MVGPLVSPGCPVLPNRASEVLLVKLKLAATPFLYGRPLLSPLLADAH